MPPLASTYMFIFFGSLNLNIIFFTPVCFKKSNFGSIEYICLDFITSKILLPLNVMVVNLNCCPFHEYFEVTTQNQTSDHTFLQTFYFKVNVKSDLRKLFFLQTLS